MNGLVCIVMMYSELNLTSKDLFQISTNRYEIKIVIRCPIPSSAPAHPNNFISMKRCYIDTNIKQYYIDHHNFQLLREYICHVIGFRDQFMEWSHNYMLFLKTGWFDSKIISVCFIKALLSKISPKSQIREITRES